MPRNTGGIRSRPNFRPGGSNYTNLSYSQDIECKDLHAFGSTVCNGESRIQGNVISGGLHVGDSGVLKVPVIAGGSVGVVPTPAPTMAGLVVVKSVAGENNTECGLFYSRLDKVAADRSIGADAILTQANATIGTNPTISASQLTTDLETVRDSLHGHNQLEQRAGAQAVIDTLGSGAGSVAENTDSSTGQDLALPLIEAKVAELAKIASNTFEWVAAN